MGFDGDHDQETVVGLAVEKMGILLQPGEHFELGGWWIEVVYVNNRRIDKLLVRCLHNPA
ncbi:transporter associated domain-containing protein [Paracoccus methylarcula]|uniref:Transporter-associated domain-containing protein n=1 Tax=Paracoccus methylarcula TaxID=72022 RepID=A0A3R7NBT2_9RHOB|nr:hypothetical protein A7A09_010830 [Paracoccus methylarcula]